MYYAPTLSYDNKVIVLGKWNQIQYVHYAVAILLFILYGLSRFVIKIDVIIINRHFLSTVAEHLQL